MMNICHTIWFFYIYPESIPDKNILLIRENKLKIILFTVSNENRNYTFSAKKYIYRVHKRKLLFHCKSTNKNYFSGAKWELIVNYIYWNIFIYQLCFFQYTRKETIRWLFFWQLQIFKRLQILKRNWMLWHTIKSVWYKVLTQFSFLFIG